MKRSIEWIIVELKRVYREILDEQIRHNDKLATLQKRQQELRSQYWEQGGTSAVDSARSS